MSELKNCPFCGNKNIILDDDNDPAVYVLQSELHIVVCDFNQGGCGASTGWEATKEQAIKAWNQRHDR